MKKEPKFDLWDISLVPDVISKISSRNECNPEYKDGFLPLIASPMDTVVSPDNYNAFLNSGIIPCMPRGEYLNIKERNYVKVFHSFGLNEIEDQLNTEELKHLINRDEFYLNQYFL